MKLDIYNLNGDLIKSCDYESSYYDNCTIRFMAKQGYTFVLDGIVIARGVAPESSQNMCNGYDQQSTNSQASALDTLSTVVSELDNIPKHEGEDLVIETLNSTLKQGKKLKIRCIETGTIYDKQSHAARDLGIDPSYVSDSIKTGKSHKGYTFERIYV